MIIIVIIILLLLLIIITRIMITMMVMIMIMIIMMIMVSKYVTFGEKAAFTFSNKIRRVMHYSFKFLSASSKKLVAQS